MKRQPNSPHRINIGFRIGAIAVLAVVAIFVAQAPSVAQDVQYEGPWCSVEDVGGGTIAERCGFDSFDECHQISGGLGSTFCRRNQRYVAPPAPPAPPVVAEHAVDPKKKPR